MAKSKTRRYGKLNARSKSWEDKESKDMKRDSRRRMSKDKDMVDKSTNDPAWYASDPAILRDAATMPFNWPLGKSLDLGPRGTDPNVVCDIPGIVALTLFPSIGNADSPSDPINVAAQSTYSFIRHANSGHSNYDAPDLMLYILAMANVYSFIMSAQRIYSVAMLWDQRNRYVPDALMRAMQVDPEDVRNNLANFRLRLNTLINKCAAMAVPSTMSIFNRTAFLYTNVYSESSSIKDQLYLYVPRAFMKFGLDPDTGAGMLAPEYVGPITTSLNMLTIDEYMSIGEGMFNAIWQEEDFGIMSGDILKAYGQNIIKLTSVDELVINAPVFDPMVLTQMHNANPAPLAEPVAIKQSDDKSYLVAPMIQTSVENFSDYTMNQILTIPSDDVTPEMVMEATRLMVTGEYNSAGDAIDLFSGTEILNNCVMLTLVHDGADLDLSNLGGWWTTGYTRAQVIYMTQFKFHPQLLIQGNESGDPRTECIYLGNIDNFRVMTPNDIKKLHEAALLNMLNVPSIGKANSWN